MFYDATKLERARLLKGWKKIQVSRITRLAPSSITNVFKGRNSSAEAVKRVADALGVPMEEIIDLEPSSTASG